MPEFPVLEAPAFFLFCSMCLAIRPIGGHLQRGYKGEPNNVSDSRSSITTIAPDSQKIISPADK